MGAKDKKSEASRADPVSEATGSDLGAVATDPPATEPDSAAVVIPDPEDAPSEGKTNDTASGAVGPASEVATKVCTKCGKNYPPTFGIETKAGWHCATCSKRGRKPGVQVAKDVIDPSVTVDTGTRRKEKVNDGPAPPYEPTDEESKELRNLWEDTCGAICCMGLQLIRDRMNRGTLSTEAIDAYHARVKRPAAAAIEQYLGQWVSSPLGQVALVTLPMLMMPGEKK